MSLLLELRRLQQTGVLPAPKRSRETLVHLPHHPPLVARPGNAEEITWPITNSVRSAILTAAMAGEHQASALDLAERRISGQTNVIRAAKLSQLSL